MKTTATTVPTGILPPTIANNSNLKRIKTIILQRSTLPGSSSLGVRSRGKPILLSFEGRRKHFMKRMKQRRVSYARLQKQQQQQIMVPPNHHFYDPEWSNSQTMCSTMLSTPTSAHKFSSTADMNNKYQNFSRWAYSAQQQRFGRPSGKGRFGKRALSIADSNGSQQLCDNSNDSGLGCDSNSESQFWLSSDDSRSLGAKSSSLPGAFPVVIPSFQTQNLAEKFVEAKKLQDTLLNKPIEAFQQPKVEPISSVPTFSEDTSTSDMLFKKVENISDNSSDFLAQIKTAPVSTIPVKRPRYSIQSNKGGNSLKLRNQNHSQNGSAGRTTIGKRFPLGAAPSLSSPLSSLSQDGSVQLQILSEPEEQHRARYQTEGSRGAIKDRKGNGFPAVKLVGYNKATTLQIFIGTDQGKVSPHMFYQVCKVTGKSSTPCVEKKVEGTIVIEIDFETSKDMVVSCDCVGILKERNVDVEQRFPFHHAAASRKKSTKCRLIFRTTIINNDGIEETLQATSLPIVCTQPPGQPEISKKSHVGCIAKGGLELIVIGKNFLKDTKVMVQEESCRGDILWEARADIQKDYLQQNHFVCIIPSYKDENIIKPVECRLIVSSGGKTSEPQRFMYIPNHSAAYYEFLAGVSHDINVSLPSPPILAGSPRLQKQLSHEGPLVTREPFLSGISRTETIANALLGGVETTKSATTIAAPLVVGPTPLTVAYENSLSPPTTAQEARQAVNELQNLLDQSVQNLASLDQDATIQSTIPGTISLTATSYSDSNLKRSLGIEPSPFTTTTTSLTQSTMPMPLQLGAFIEPQAPQQLSPQVQMPSQGITSFQQNPGPSLTCSVTQASNLPQLIDAISGMGESELLATNLICQSSAGNSPVQIMENNDPMVGGIGPMMDTSPTVANCLADTLMKIEPSSPPGAVVPSVTTAPIVTTSGETNFIGNQHCISQVTQMSDNELLNYINPSCFEQATRN